MGRGQFGRGAWRGAHGRQGPQAGAHAPGIISPLNPGPSGWGWKLEPGPSPQVRPWRSDCESTEYQGRCRLLRAWFGAPYIWEPPFLVLASEAQCLACSRDPQRSPLLLPIRTPAPRLGLPLPAVLLRLLGSLCPTHCSVGPRGQGTLRLGWGQNLSATTAGRDCGLEWGWGVGALDSQRPYATLPRRRDSTRTISGLALPARLWLFPTPPPPPATGPLGRRILLKPHQFLSCDLF